MKKNILFVAIITAIAFAATGTVNAQIATKITVVKDSTVNADNTTIALPVESTVKAVEIHATKISGTIAGKAVLEGLAPDGSNWIGIDSIALADQAFNFKLFSLPIGIPHLQYRFKVTETGTGKQKPIVAYTLRRSN